MTTTWLRGASCILLLSFVLAACEVETNSTPPSRLELFEFGQVTLDEGRLKQKWDEVIDYYMDIPVDNMLYEYRIRTGMPNPPGEQLQGWYIQLVGYSLNEWISSFTRMYAITGESRFKERADELIDGWWERFNRSPGGLMWYNSAYAVKRWMDALLDHYEYTGAESSLNRLSILVQWMENTLETSRKFGDNGSEWYTLSESLYRAYSLTGKEKYKTLAEFWEYTDYWDLFANGTDPLTRKPEVGMNTEFVHAYSHVNSLNSAAEAYRVKQEPYYLEAMKEAYRWVKDTQQFATGGYGPGLEHFMPLDRIIEDLESSHAHFETGAHWMASSLSRNLLSFTGDSQYGNWMEALIYNGILSALPMKPDGMAMSYFDYNLNGGKKEYGWRGESLAWTSGASTLPLDVSEWHRSIYFYEHHDLYINLFTPSTLRWNRNNNEITFKMKTSYPESEHVAIELTMAEKERFSVNFRIPEWVKEPDNIKALVNGKAIKFQVVEGQWGRIDRNWSNKDVLSIQLPMELWINRLGDQSNGPAAIMYGPLAMPLKGASRKSLRQIPLDQQNEAFIKSPDKLEFRWADNEQVVLKPYFAYEEGELYYLYIN